VPFGLHEGAWITSSVIHGRSPSANVTYPRNEGSEHLRTWDPRAVALGRRRHVFTKLTYCPQAVPVVK